MRLVQILKNCVAIVRGDGSAYRRVKPNRLIVITAEEMIEEGIIIADVVEAEAGVIVQGIEAVGTPLDRIAGVEVETTLGIGGNMIMIGRKGDVTNTKR